jgi:NAD(P)-dependent dehydrogenase (short-subunit alcohol dehydrogenase family)
MEEQPMGDRLDGRVAVVTGGASGIGEAAVRRFVEEGARVVVADVQVDRGEAVAAAIGDAARFVRCDVTNEDAVADAIRFAVDTWGRLDVMFNNAGVVGAIGPIAETDTDAWLRTIDILVHSVFYGCKHAARAMVAQGFGSIINTSSAAGVMGGLGPHAYTTAKTAVIGLTKSVASELGPKGVRCNAIAPGTIPTPLTAVVTTGDASDLANAALYLASDEAAFVNGHTLVVDYGRTINGGSPRFASAAPKLMGIAGTDEQ